MELPEHSAKDTAFKLTKGALGAIPFAGAFIGELMELVIVPQYQKKLEEWFKFVDSTIGELVEKHNITKEKIFSDEEFISIFQRTSRAYVNNIEKHKVPILKGYLKSSITKNIELNKKLLFLEIIDKLTEKHFMILKEISVNDVSSNYKYKDDLTKVLTAKFANGESNYFRLLEKGLQNFHLLSYGSANVVENDRNQWHMNVSNIGKELIEFISIG